VSKPSHDGSSQSSPEREPVSSSSDVSITCRDLGRVAPETSRGQLQKVHYKEKDQQEAAAAAASGTDAGAKALNAPQVSISSSRVLNYRQLMVSSSPCSMQNPHIVAACIRSRSLLVHCDP
jgi:hypothetical protein